MSLSGSRCITKLIEFKSKINFFFFIKRFFLYFYLTV